MANIDLKNDISNVDAFTPATIATDTTTAGSIIDMQDFESLTFLLRASTYTDGTYTPLIEDGDDSGLSDAAAVADAFLIGTEADAALSAAGESRIGYVGKKRYVRLSYVSTSTTTGATLDAVAVKGSPRHSVVA
jgi:hypothetical protein